MPTGQCAATLAGIALSAGILVACGDAEEGEPSTGRSILNAVRQSDPLTQVPEDLEGAWAGQVTSGDGEQLRMAVRFAREEPIDVAYAGRDCGGNWIWTGTLDSLPPYHLFEERIDQGHGDDCLDESGVELHPREPGPYRHIEFVSKGGALPSKGVLTPVDEDDLRRVFDEAGVEAPD